MEELIPSFNQKDSYPAADPGALYCRLAQELQKNPSVSQSFTIANAETLLLSNGRLHGAEGFPEETSDGQNH